MSDQEKRTSLIEDSLADADSIKKAAEQAAIKKLLEEMSPHIKRAINKTINEQDDKDNLSLDDLLDSEGGPEPSSKEVKTGADVAAAKDEPDDDSVVKFKLKPDGTIAAVLDFDAVKGAIEDKVSGIELASTSSPGVEESPDLESITIGEETPEETSEETPEETPAEKPKEEEEVELDLGEVRKLLHNILREDTDGDNLEQYEDPMPPKDEKVNLDVNPDEKVIIVDETGDQDQLIVDMEDEDGDDHPVDAAYEDVFIITDDLPEEDKTAQYVESRRAIRKENKCEEGKQCESCEDLEECGEEMKLEKTDFDDKDEKKDDEKILVDECDEEANKMAYVGENKKLKKMINGLNLKLRESNLLNAKLLFTNKLLLRKDLSFEQFKSIVESFDKAETMREAKLVFESALRSANNGARELSEASGRRNSGRFFGSSSAPMAKALTEIKSNDGVDAEENDLKNRWQLLAGISE